VRLGGNALSECLVFGGRAGLAAAQYASKSPERKLCARSLEKSLEKAADNLEGAPSVTERYLARKIGQIKSLAAQTLGPVREGRGLAKAERIFGALMEEGQKMRAGKKEAISLLLDFRALALSGYLSAASAGLRLESRGGHYRSDHPEEKPGFPEGFTKGEPGRKEGGRLESEPFLSSRPGLLSHSISQGATISSPDFQAGAAL
jgi:succinate dehydrogenase/fumarate reductase flavoprotein subunit